LSKIKFAFFSAVVSAAAIIGAVFAGAEAEELAAPGTAEGKVIVVIADYLDIEDISEMEYLGRLAGRSHVSLMNNRQPGKAGAEKSKLIIGSGKRLELNDNMVLGGSGEEYLNGYRIASGRKAVTGRLAYMDLHKLRDRNSGSEFLNYIGYLGDAVNENNGTACYLGNADTSEKDRSSMLVAMDSSGMVDLGETENILIEDELFPFGRRTDYNRLAELYKQYLPASSFMVIETGDMERLEAYGTSMSNDSCELYKQAILKDIDSFIEELVSYNGFRTLIFMSTYPSRSSSERNNRLTPVISYETGEEGLLCSSSTRREGIVLNTDIADYILCKLGYAGTSAITEVKRDKALYFLEAMNKSIVITSVFRSPVLTTYAVMVMAALCVLFAGVIFLRKEYGNIVSWLISLTAYIILAFPIVLLYLPASSTGGSQSGYIAITIAASALLSIILQWLLKDKIKVMLAMCLLLLTGISADVVTGSTLIKQSVLGYDPVIGARFYGIGNEYAGMFIGCSLMVNGCIQELTGARPNKAAGLLYFTACTLLMGLTFLGANFGGALAGAVGYLLAYFLVFGIKFNIRNACIGMIILCAAPAALLISDSLGIKSPSHMGSLVKEAGANGPGVIFSTIQRKVSMNLRLIRYTIWTKVLLSIIAIIAFMFWRPARLLQKLFDRYKYLRYSWISIAAAAITGFAVNDSGIVVAATAMIYTAFTMLLMCIDERNES